MPTYTKADSRSRQQRGQTEPIYQMIPLYSNEGEGWIQRGLNVEWGKVKKLKQSPGCIIHIRRKRENEGGLVESKPIAYFIKNGQTTLTNQATVDGCTPDQVLEALKEHDELGKRFKLIEYTETQAEIERQIQRQKAVVSKKDQSMLEGSEGLVNGKAESKIMNPNSAMAMATDGATNEAGIVPQQFNQAGFSQLQREQQPVFTDDGMVTSEIRPMAD